METIIEKLQKLTQSVAKLETALDEMWSCLDEIGDDDEFGELMDKVEQHESLNQKSDERTEELNFLISEFENYLGQIPENGTAAVAFEESISQLSDWIKKNK